MSVRRDRAALVSVRSIWNREPGASRAGKGPSAAWDGTFGLGDGLALGSAWGL